MRQKRATAPSLLCLILVTVLGLFPAARIQAQESTPDFDYDIFLRGDTISVWLDITPALNQSRMEDLLAGLAIVIDLDFKLETPRLLGFDKTIVSRQYRLVINRQVVEDLYCFRSSTAPARVLGYADQIGLSDYLADSLVFPLTVAKGLTGERIRMILEVDSKSMSENKINRTNEKPIEAEDRPELSEKDFMESLFERFLGAIGFGRTSYKIESSVFTVSDLISEPR